MALPIHIEELLSGRVIPFDDRVHHRASLKDLSLGLIRDFLNEINSDLFEQSIQIPFADLCRQMSVVRGPNESLRPIHAGLLFFCEHPERFFDRSWIEVVLYKNAEGNQFTEKIFKGPLHIQLRNALSYINSLVIEERIQKFRGRAEADRFFNFPYNAVEEALANAVFHKDYSSGKPIEVQVWPDKIEILSFPGPLPPVTSATLATNRRIVARDYRNRRIGDFLKELHLTEGRGTGIPAMRRAMTRNGSPLPILETDELNTYFLTVLPVHPAFHLDVQGNGQFGSQVQEAGFGVFVPAVNPVVSQVIRICVSPSSTAEVLEKMGFDGHDGAYQRFVLPALDNGWIEWDVAEQQPHGSGKLRTTPSGHALLDLLAHASSM